ncbi:MAG: TonB-dependent receptor plug domain-containing protein [Prevotella sp.]|nr:TonB-dependent receptor plug domain-containing protein [Prevotella sp.]
MKATRLIILLLLLLTCQMVGAQQPSAAVGGHTVSLTVTDKDSKETVIMANCSLDPLGAFAVTDVDGKASFGKVPSGQFTMKVTYVGYEPYTTVLKVDADMTLSVQLVPTSLALKEVVVTARQNVSGASTSSVIGRQAIDHLQATSLADVMQLIPGHKMGNTDLTQQANLQLRTLHNNSTSAFGSSIIVDGVPLSNNGQLTQGQFSPTAFTGTDLRQVAADNIDNVEIIRGIPSAEYGDLTSGLVVIHSKMGVTPWQIKAKVNPNMTNASLTKGFSLNRAGVLNVNFDYAKAWGDPRQKTRSFNRYSFNLGYSYDLSKRWHTETKFRLLYAKDWSGNDPNALQDGTFLKHTTLNLGLTHNGRIAVDRLLMRTLNYTLGISYGEDDNEQSSFVTNSTGLLPILTARETGYHRVPWMTQSYLATGRTESRPGNVYAKVSDTFFFRSGNTRQNFKVGAEYHYDWNGGRGYYNLNDSLPFRPNSDGRPRAFSDVPGLHQVAAYAEDNFLWNINRVNRLRANLGLRLTAMQPFSHVATTALSPRLNLSFSVTRWLDIRGGIGLNSKTPGLAYLYPDAKYDDRVAANYMPQDDRAAQLLVYHTQAYRVAYSSGLRNATTTKVELGADFKLPGSRRLSILAYQDRTPNGFAPLSDFYVYPYSLYTQAQGLVITPGQPTQVDYANPSRSFMAYMTKGTIGNTNTTINRGVELDFELGEIRPIHTSFFFSGAYSETKTYSTDRNTEAVRASLLPAEYADYNVTPFRVVYPSGVDYSKYRQFLNTLRIVTNIPALKMVASFTAQAVWYDWNLSYSADKNPIGFFGADLVEHPITQDMMTGFLGMDGQYYATKPVGIATVALADLASKASDNKPSKSPVEWNLQGRLTKQLGNFGGLSLYVNNMIYYEPFLRGNNTESLVQRNTGKFSFGVELYFNL